MSEQESVQLSKFFFRPDGSLNPEIVGKTALELARHSGICVPTDTLLLISEQKYVSSNNPYSREKLCPVLAFYVEKDWMNACEKCVELLINEGRGHTLVIHSKNENVIREFALKKPVSRVLVNTPASLGGIGATTNLFPALTLGSGTAGGGYTSDNVTPMNLINIRKVGYGVRQLEDITKGVDQLSIESTDDLKEVLEKLLELLK